MKLTPITWDQVFLKYGLCGCFMESRKEKYVECGPLSKVSNDGTNLHLQLPWTARCSLNMTEWHYLGESSAWMVDMKKVLPLEAADGCIYFTVPFIEVCRIFPQSQRQLEA